MENVNAPAAGGQGANANALIFGDGLPPQLPAAGAPVQDDNAAAAAAAVKAADAFAMKSLQSTLAVFEKKLTPLKDASTYPNWIKGFKNIATAKMLWDFHLAPSTHGDAKVPSLEIRNTATYQFRKQEAWLLLLSHCSEKAALRFVSKTDCPRTAMDLLAAAFLKDSETDKVNHLKKLLSIKAEFETLESYVARFEALSACLTNAGGAVDPATQLVTFEGALPPHLQDYASSRTGQPETATKDGLLIVLEAEVTKRQAGRYATEFLIGGLPMKKPYSGNQHHHSSGGVSSSRNERALLASGRGGETNGGRYKEYICHGCGKKGHIRSECRSSSRKPNRETAATAEASSKASSRKKTPSSSSHASTTSRKTKGRYVSYDTDEEAGLIAQEIDYDSDTSSGPPSLRASPNSESDSEIDDFPVSYQEKWDQWSADQASMEAKTASFQAIVDSGSTRHMVTADSLAHLSDYKPFNSDQRIAIVTSSQNAKIYAVGQGTLHVRSNQGQPVKFDNVLYVPALSHNLISVKAAVAKGCSVSFQGSKCQFTAKDGRVLLTATLTGSQYMVLGSYTDVASPIAAVGAMLSSVTASGSNATASWHERLGHIAAKQLLRLQELDLISGVTTAAAKVLTCDSCATAKAHRLPYDISTTERPTDPNILISLDLSGPYRTTRGGMRYVLAFIDHFDDDVTVYFLKRKSESPRYIEQFLRYCETQYDHPVKTLRSDNAGEFSTKALQNFYRRCGVKHETTSPYSSKSNGKVERFFRTMFDAVRTGLARSGLPDRYWAEAANHFVYTRRRSYIPKLNPSLGTNTKTIFELRSGTVSPLSRLHPFGSICTVLNEGGMTKSKTQLRGSTAALLGYAEDAKAYKILIIESRKILLRRHVTFGNSIRYYGDLVQATAPRVKNRPTELVPTDSESGGEDSSSADNETNSDSESSSADSDDEDPPPPADANDVPPPLHPDNDEEPWQPVLPRRSKRETAPRQYSHPLVHSKLSIASTDSSTVPEAPATLAEAIKSPHWRSSIIKELTALRNNKTWVPVDLPPGRKAIRAKMIFKNKLGPDHTLLSRKSRLVFLGYNQVKNVDYFDTYSGVVKTSSLFAVLAQAAHEGREVITMDVNTAFLESKMKDGEDLYMEMPPIYEWLEAHPDATDFPPEAMNVNHRK